MDAQDRTTSAPNLVMLHVEIVHDDPEAAAEFLVRTAGAERVELRMAEYLTGRHPDLHVVHVRVGGLVLQIVRPPHGVERFASWRRQLDEQGPGVHDVCFRTPGLEGLHDEMLAQGVVEAAAFRGMTLGESGLDAPGTQDGYLLDAREQCGLRFELIDDIPAWVSGEAP